MNVDSFAVLTAQFGFPTEMQLLFGDKLYRLKVNPVESEPVEKFRSLIVIDPWCSDIFKRFVCAASFLNIDAFKEACPGVCDH